MLTDSFTFKRRARFSLHIQCTSWHLMFFCTALGGSWGCEWIPTQIYCWKRSRPKAVRWVIQPTSAWSLWVACHLANVLDKSTKIRILDFSKTIDSSSLRRKRLRQPVAFFELLQIHEKDWGASFTLERCGEPLCRLLLLGRPPSKSKEKRTWMVTRRQQLMRHSLAMLALTAEWHQRISTPWPASLF